MLEFYAKNVAIRRSRSKWVLPLALDTVLTGEWWDYLAQRPFVDTEAPVLFRMLRADLSVPMPMPSPDSDWQRVQQMLLNNYVKVGDVKYIPCFLFKMLFPPIVGFQVFWNIAAHDFGHGSAEYASDVREV